MRTNYFVIICLVVTILFFMIGCTTDTATDTVEVLTLDQLSQYDGQNGNPAYISVDGTIYDVTNVPQWKDGEHNGFSAGKDLTEEIKNISPHGVSKLKGLPVVGKLAE